MPLFRFGESLATKCIPLNNEPCIGRSTLIDLISDDLGYHSFIVGLYRGNGSWDNLNESFHRMCVPTIAKDNLQVFNKIAVINQSKTPMKYISEDIRCKFKG